MPNRKVHTTTGTIIGGGFALYKARNQEPHHMALEAIGGALAGSIGGRIPDLIDPATSPRHRSIGHSVIPNSLVGGVYFENLNSWQDSIRHYASNHQTKRKQTDSFFEKFWFGLLEILCHLAAGALAGLGVGHASHLALDLCTPARLPLMA